jgi:transcriptional regulator with GAF, ATPase, and Fis domain
MARLLVEEGGTSRYVELGDRPLRVGSGTACELLVEGDGVSKEHFVVERSPTGWRLKDAGSKGGTRINGSLVAARRLRSGDRIEIGDAVLTFQDAKTAKAAAVAAKRLPRVDTPARPASEDVRRLKTTLRALASETDDRKLLALIVDQVISLTGAERGFLILRGAERKFEMVAARTLDRENVRRPAVKISRAVAGEVARTGKPLLTTNAQADARLQSSPSVSGLKLRSVLCLPLKARGRFLGFLYMDHRFEEGVFRADDLELVEAFADQAAVALEDQRVLAELRERTEELARSKERVEELNRLLEQQLDVQRRELDEVRTLLRDRGDRPLKYEYADIVGSSDALREVLRLVDHVTDTSVPVLVLGESGTGKELIARAIHHNGPRSTRRFVTENCAAIPANLLESVLFGHVKGAFTGADRDREGLFELADGGTMFLDEVGELPLEMQVKLLRVLETGELRRVGGKDTRRVDVRIISATNRDLAAMVSAGEFREDLYYRINVLQVRVPPLRERRADVAELVQHFLRQQASESGDDPKTGTDEAMRVLTGYEWPGNVRQLRNEILRAVALSEHVILPEVLSPELRNRSLPTSDVSLDGGRALKDIVQEAVDELERRLVSDALRESGWRKTDAARTLRVSRPTLDAKIKRLMIRRPGE